MHERAHLTKSFEALEVYYHQGFKIWAPWTIYHHSQAYHFHSPYTIHYGPHLKRENPGRMLKCSHSIVQDSQ